MKFEEISKNIYSKYSKDDIQRRMLLLGKSNDSDVYKFLNLRLVSSIIIFFIIIYFVEWGYILGPITVILYYLLLPKMTIDVKIKKRCKRLEQEAMYFFEILALSLESGNNLYNAISITSENIDGDLSREFRKMINDINYGKSFSEAISDVKKRIPSDTIGNILLNIKEANMFGNNIIGTLNNQLDYLREMRILETKAYISKIPLKISVISVVFFIPLLLLLILGPVLINYLN
jgi:pilus assembly protein TadC